MNSNRGIIPPTAHQACTALGMGVLLIAFELFLVL